MEDKYYLTATCSFWEEDDFYYAPSCHGFESFKCLECDKISFLLHFTRKYYSGGINN